MQFRCTNCDANLKIADDRAGKTIKCPKCGVRMVVPTAEVAITTQPETRPVIEAAAPERRRRREWDDDVDDRRRDRIARPSSFPWLLLCLCLGGVLALGLLFVGGLAFWLLARVDAPPQVNVVAEAAAEIPVEEAPLVPPNLRPARQPSPFAVPKGSDEEFDKMFLGKLQFQRKTLIEEYEKVGKKDGRWDKPAKEALEVAAQTFADMQYLERQKLSNVRIPVKRAIAAGCDDPLLLYLLWRTRGSVQEGKRATRDEELAEATAGYASLQASDYSAFRKHIAIIRYFVVVSGGPEAKQADSPEHKKGLELLDEALLLAPEAYAQCSACPPDKSSAFDLLETLLADHRYLTGDDEKSLAWLDAGIKDAPQLAAARLKLRGQHYLGYAWKARGDGFANEVKPEQFRLFRERLQIARDSLEKAWDIEPNDGFTAATLLPIVKGLGGDRAAMKLWFDRAMAADPGNKVACLQMLDYLDPKWFGTEEQMLAFGRACGESGQWTHGTTLLVADAHCRIMNRRQGPQQRRYFRNPEVWNDIKSAYEPYLEKRPSDWKEHSHFAFYAHLCGHDDIARQHFAVVGHAYPMDFIDLAVIEQTRLMLFQKK